MYRLCCLSFFIEVIMSMSTTSTTVSATTLAAETHSTTAAVSTTDTKASLTGISGSGVSTLTSTQTAQVEKPGLFAQVSRQVAALVNKVCSFFESAVSYVTSFFKKSEPTTKTDTTPATQATTASVDLLKTEQSARNIQVFSNALKSSIAEMTLRTSFNWMLTGEEQVELAHEVWVQDGSKSTDTEFGMDYIKANPKGELLIRAADAVLARKLQAISTK